MPFITKKTCANVPKFAVFFIFVLVLSYLFQDQLSDPHR